MFFLVMVFADALTFAAVTLVPTPIIDIMGGLRHTERDALVASGGPGEAPRVRLTRAAGGRDRLHRETDRVALTRIVRLATLRDLDTWTEDELAGRFVLARRRDDAEVLARLADAGFPVQTPAGSP